MNGPDFEKENAEMQQFEQAVSRAMRRVEVPAATTAKLLALTDPAELNRRIAGSRSRMFKLPNSWRAFALSQLPQASVWMGGAIAAVLATGCFVGAHIHTEHERRAHAERQFEAAERITDQALEHTRERLQEQGIYLDR